MGVPAIGEPLVVPPDIGVPLAAVEQAEAVGVGVDPPWCAAWSSGVGVEARTAPLRLMVATRATSATTAQSRRIEE